MGLLGTGAVAIWHDIVPEGRRAFYDWHGNEHMLERVGIPGFFRGRRYVALRADLEFFNLYEAASLDTLRGPDYKARLNDPTPWTVETVKFFRRVNRSMCSVTRSAGPGGGGLVATLRYDAEDHSDDAVWREVLEPLLAADGVAAVHLLAADKSASAVDNAESKSRGVANAIPGRAILVEGWGDAAPFMALAEEALAEDRMRALGAGDPIALGIYQHQLTIDELSAGATG